VEWIVCLCASLCTRITPYLFIIFLPSYPSSLFSAVIFHFTFALKSTFHHLFPFSNYALTLFQRSKCVTYYNNPHLRERITKGMLVTVLVHQCQLLISTVGLALISSISSVFVIVATHTDFHS